MARLKTAKALSRVLCKGAISFGRVHTPVGLQWANTESGLDFDWLDKRSMDPVGYERINKKLAKTAPKNTSSRAALIRSGRGIDRRDRQAGLNLIHVRRACRPCFKAFVDPKVLSWLVFDVALQLLIHEGGIGHHIISRKVFPCRGNV